MKVVVSECSRPDINVLLREIQSGNHERTQSALKEFGAFRTHTLKEVREIAYGRCDDPNRRQAAFIALTGIGDESDLKKLVDIVNRSVEGERQNDADVIVCNLWRMGEKAIPHLKKMTWGEYPFNTNYFAAQSLVRLGDAESMPLIEAVIRRAEAGKRDYADLLRESLERLRKANE